MLVISTEAACFDGEISNKSVESILKWLSRDRSSHSRPLLAIRSGGGDAAAGIDVVDKLQASDATVHVIDLCASSCANYFFAGVKYRSVSNGALLLFHGGYSAASREAAIAELDKLHQSNRGAALDWDKARSFLIADMDNNMARQDALYAKIGVDSAIVHGFDRIDADALSEANCDPTRAAPRDFLFLTVPQLAALGVHIEHGRPASDPEEVNRKIEHMGAKFEACGLPQSVFERFVRK